MKKFCLLLCLACIVASSSQAQTANVSFQYYESLIYIKVNLNNKKDLLFLVNTGANSSVVDSRTAAELKLPAYDRDSVIGTVGREAVEILRANTIQIGGLTLRNRPITKRDLGGFITPNNTRLNGILGTDILAHYFVQIDYNKKKISFLPSRPPAFKQQIPFTMNNGFPVVQAKMNDTLIVPLYFNSGVSLRPSPSIYVNVSEALWRKLKTINPHLTPQSHLTVRGVGGSAFLPVIPMTSIELDRFRILQPSIIVQPSGGYFQKDDVAGFFGNNLLEKYQKVCLDFTKGVISFNTPKSYGAYIYEQKKAPANTQKRVPKKRR